MPVYSAPARMVPSRRSRRSAWLLILRAFASGSVALTGTEAVSQRCARVQAAGGTQCADVLVLMAAFFGIIFIGVSFLVGQLGILPDPSEEQTVLSQLTATLVGAGALPLPGPVRDRAAAGPGREHGLRRLSAPVEHPGARRLPAARVQFRGERLAFNGGIIVLALVAAVLLVAFGGSVSALIPLYTVGVFLAFTLSQSGMVRHWSRLREVEPGWRRRSLINGLGALTTGVVAIEVAATKFNLRRVGGGDPHSAADRDDAVHQAPIQLDGRTARGPGEEGNCHGPRRDERVIVPVAGINRAVVQAINVGRSVADDVLAVLVSDDPGSVARARRWERQLPDIPLVIVESPYRALVNPMLAYLDVLDGAGRRRDAPITFVVIPEFVARHWWERILYNQSANRLRRALLGRPHTVVVTSVPSRGAGSRVAGRRRRGFAGRLDGRPPDDFHRALMLGLHAADINATPGAQP